jgi:hypothetical protein
MGVVGTTPSRASGSDRHRSRVESRCRAAHRQRAARRFRRQPNLTPDRRSSRCPSPTGQDARLRSPLQSLRPYRSRQGRPHPTPGDAPAARRTHLCMRSCQITHWRRLAAGLLGAVRGSMSALAAPAASRRWRKVDAWPARRDHEQCRPSVGPRAGMVSRKEMPASRLAVRPAEAAGTISIGSRSRTLDRKFSCLPFGQRRLDVVDRPDQLAELQDRPTDEEVDPSI